ncbi:MAG: hypothetical protein ACLPVO_06565 [Desulfomonilaceae bacterium]
MKKKPERKEDKAGAGRNRLDMALVYTDEIISSVTDTMAARIPIQGLAYHLIGRELKSRCPYKTDRCACIESCKMDSCPDSFHLTMRAEGLFNDDWGEDLRSFYATSVRKMETQIALYVDRAIREDKAEMGEPLPPEAIQELLEGLRVHVDNPDDEK